MKKKFFIFIYLFDDDDDREVNKSCNCWKVFSCNWIVNSFNWHAISSRIGNIYSINIEMGNFEACTKSGNPELGIGTSIHTVAVEAIKNEKKRT